MRDGEGAASQRRGLGTLVCKLYELTADDVALITAESGDDRRTKIEVRPDRMAVSLTPIVR